MYTYVINWSRLFLAGWAFYFENNYFGWNRLPMSDAELVCDLMILFMLAMSISREPVNV